MTLQTVTQTPALIAPIEGWAAIYNDVDLNGDVIAPGALARSIRRLGAGGVRMLYQHAPEKPIGRWTRFEERDGGLYAFGELTLSAALSREAYALIRARALDGLSIGFATRRAVRVTTAPAGDRAVPRRRILEADLWEVSIVTFPMAPAARITRLGQPEKERVSVTPDKAAFAASLRDAGRILAAMA